MNQLISALLVGLVGVFCMLDSRVLGRLNFEQPLVACTLVGVVLGNVPLGLAVGASIELIAMGIVNVGAAIPPDMTLGGIIAAAFAILSGASVEVAMTIAIPIAVLGQLLRMVCQSTILPALGHLADRYVDEGKFKQVCFLHIIVGNIIYSLMYFVPIFAAIYLGTDVVSSVVNMIPQWLIAGLKVSAKILTAFGLAMLLQLMLNKQMSPFLLIGFLMAAYLKLDVMGISLFAVALAVVLAEIKFRPQTAAASSLDYDPLEDDEL